MAVAFFAGAFFAGAFFAAAFFADAFFAGAFFAGAFFADTFLAGALLAAAFFAGAFLATAFFAGAFFVLLSVFSLCLKASPPGAPGLPALRIFSPLPFFMRFCFAWIFAYRPGFLVDIFPSIKLGFAPDVVLPNQGKANNFPIRKVTWSTSNKRQPRAAVGNSCLRWLASWPARPSQLYC